MLYSRSPLQEVEDVYTGQGIVNQQSSDNWEDESSMKNSKQ